VVTWIKARANLSDPAGGGSKGKLDRLPALAAELVALNVDVIVAPNALQ